MSAVNAVTLIDEFVSMVADASVTKRGKFRGILVDGVMLRERLANIRDAVTADPDWSEVTESNLRAELAEVKATLAAEIIAETTMAVLYESALQHVEGERDRARDVAVRLEQEVHALTVGSGRRVL